MAIGPRWEPAQPTFGLTSSGGCVPTDDLRVSLVPSGGGPVARAPLGVLFLGLTLAATGAAATRGPCLAGGLLPAKALTL